MEALPVNCEICFLLIILSVLTNRRQVCRYVSRSISALLKYAFDTFYMSDSCRDEVTMVNIPHLAPIFLVLVLDSVDAKQV